MATNNDDEALQAALRALEVEVDRDIANVPPVLALPDSPTNVGHMFQTASPVATPTAGDLESFIQSLESESVTGTTTSLPSPLPEHRTPLTADQQGQINELTAQIRTLRDSMHDTGFEIEDLDTKINIAIVYHNWPEITTDARNRYQEIIENLELQKITKETELARMKLRLHSLMRDRLQIIRPSSCAMMGGARRRRRRR
jgi:hypothetical protein